MAWGEAAKQFGLVALGGAVGSVLRYAVALATAPTKSGFAWSVFTVNMVGSFVIGLAAGHFATKPNANLQLLLMVGLLGGFTTFSSFSLENLVLLKEGSLGIALLNIVGQCVLGLILAALGYAITGRG